MDLFPGTNMSMSAVSMSEWERLRVLGGEKKVALKNGSGCVAKGGGRKRCVTSSLPDNTLAISPSVSDCT